MMSKMDEKRKITAKELLNRYAEGDRNIIDIRHTTICPKCHKRIYKLVAYVKTYDVFENMQGKLRYKKLESWDLGNESIYEYKCPECGKVIATSQEEVEDIFR